MTPLSLSEFNESLSYCQRCPRLVASREQVARHKRRAYASEIYWGKPVPGMGDPNARLLILGLAPGAHGANRTGKMFSGDKAGEFVFRTLYKTGYALNADPPEGDNACQLRDVYLTNAVRCAPPANKPTRDEQARCREHLVVELGMLVQVRVVLALGKIAFDNFLLLADGLGQKIPQPRPKFSHGMVTRLGDWQLVASYHPSQRNTQTGRLTAHMFETIVNLCRQLAQEG